jgi:hypothetical protein
VAFGTTLQVSADLAGASTESVAQTAAAALAGASADAADATTSDGGHFSGEHEVDSQTNTSTPKKRNNSEPEPTEVVTPSPSQIDRGDKVKKVVDLADVNLNRRLQEGVPDDPPGQNEVLQVADDFTLLFRREHRLLFWPCAGNLQPPHFVIDATGAIKFKGAIKSNQVKFFRWPVIGGTVDAQGFQTALDEVKDALRRQLAKWQSEGTAAVRCRSKASS